MFRYFSPPSNLSCYYYSTCTTGYHGGQSEGQNGLLQHTMEAVRRVAEKQDYYGGTVVLHSLSGGTGSGK